MIVVVVDKVFENFVVVPFHLNDIHVLTDTRAISVPLFHSYGIERLRIYKVDPDGSFHIGGKELFVAHLAD
jgi:hypothetical protein